MTAERVSRVSVAHFFHRMEMSWNITLRLPWASSTIQYSSSTVQYFVSGWLLISTDIYWYLLIVLRLTLSDCESCAWVGRSASAWRVLPTASGHFPSQGLAHQRTLTKWPHHELNGAEVEYPWNALWNASLGTVCNTLRAWFKFHNRQYMAPHTCVLSLSLVWKQLTKHHVSPFSVHTALIKNCQYVAVVHNLSLDHYDLQAPLLSTSIPRHSTAE